MKFAKVMYSQVSVCPRGGVCTACMPPQACICMPPQACHLDMHAPEHAHCPGMHVPPGMPTWALMPPWWILRDVLNERTVRILLECILVIE